jgi:hypothetical protein
VGWLLSISLIILSFGLYAYPLPDPLAASVIIEDQRGHGSGGWISPTQVLTARHVAQHAQDTGARVRGPDGDIYHIADVAIGPADIAIITVDRPFKGIPLGFSCTRRNRGDRLFYFGSPGVVEFAGPISLIVTYGATPKLRDEEPEMVDSTIMVLGEGEPGVSGSPVLDPVTRRVVGVYTFAWSGTIFGGYVSLQFPDVCEFITRELNMGKNA